MPVASLVLIFAAQLVAAQPTEPATPSQRIEIVLFSDFQCPFCAQLAPAIRQLQAQTGEGIETTVVFKNFPLFIHPAAQLAHQAAMAALAQGKFWQMHDLIFANQRRAQRSDLVEYARTIGLDMARFARDLDSEETRRLIAADIAEGNARRISGTPAYTINGKSYTGTRSFEQLNELLSKERRRARALAEITDDVVSKGPLKAPVTLELFLDLQSPVSAPALDVVNQLLRRYPSAVRVLFRNFPLAFHPDAPLAHEAAMVAAREGRFWEFVGFILAHQDSLREQDLVGYAGSLGLNQEQFADAIHQHRYAARVDADLESGLGRGIRGSPVILVNTTRIDGVPSLDTLVGYVETALKDHAAIPAERP